MSDNWLALAVAILSPEEIQITKALKLLKIKVSYNKNNVIIDDEQFDKIKELRSNKISWNDIAEQLEFEFTGELVRDKFYSILAKKRTAKTPTKVVSAAK